MGVAAFARRVPMPRPVQPRSNQAPPTKHLRRFFMTPQMIPNPVHHQHPTPPFLGQIAAGSEYPPVDFSARTA